MTPERRDAFQEFVSKYNPGGESWPGFFFCCREVRVKVLIQMLAVGGAGFVGAVARLLIGWGCGRAFPGFPVGTMLINLTGSAFLGWFYAYAGGRIGFPETLRLAIAVGFVGSYTTFSTFMYESDALMRQGAWLKASTNIAGSLFLGLLAVHSARTLHRGRNSNSTPPLSVLAKGRMDGRKNPGLRSRLRRSSNPRPGVCGGLIQLRWCARRR